MLERIQVRRALGIKLRDFDYRELAEHKPPSEAVVLLKEAVEVHPDSYQLLAYLALMQRRANVTDESKITLELALRKFEEEMKLLSQFAGKDKTPPTHELRLRMLDAVTCNKFLAICFVAADQTVVDQVAQRLERSIEMIGGDPSEISEIRAAVSSKAEKIGENGALRLE